MMSISRKLGILVFLGVPAIIGGGIFYAVFGGYLPVIIYELSIYCWLAGGTLSANNGCIATEKVKLNIVDSCATPSSPKR